MTKYQQMFLFMAYCFLLAPDSRSGEPKKENSPLRAILVHQSILPKEVSSAKFSPDGKLLAASDVSRTLVFWEMPSGKERFRLDDAGGGSFLEDGAKFAVFSRDTLKKWDTTTGRAFPIQNLKTNWNLVGFLPGEKQMLTASKGWIQVRDTKNGEVERQFQVARFSNALHRRALSIDGKWVAVYTPSNLTNKEPAITVWEVETGKSIVSIGTQDKRITSICFSPSGESIASANFDNTIQIWNAKTGKLERRINARWLPVKIAYSPDGQWLAVGYGGNFRDVSVFDTTTGTEVLTLQRAVWESTSTGAITFNPQGTHLAAATGRYVQVWEISTKKGGLKKGVPDAEKR